MSKHYLVPPVIEAFAEIHFEQNTLWDLTIPGLIYAQIRKDFPTREQVNLLNLEIRPGINPQDTSSVVTKMQFYSENREQLIQVSPYQLAVNRLRPYKSWDSFKDIILAGFNAYSEVANPETIKRIGLTYINQFEINEEPFKLNEYFDYGIKIGENLPKEHGPFQVVTQFTYNKAQSIAEVTLSTAGIKLSNTLVVNLVISFSYTGEAPLDLHNVSSWLEEAHTHISEIFEGSIKQRLRETFKEVA